MDAVKEDWNAARFMMILRFIGMNNTKAHLSNVMMTTGPRLKDTGPGQKLETNGL